MLMHVSTSDTAVTVGAAKCSTCTIRVQIFSTNLAAYAFLTTENGALAKPPTTFLPATLALVQVFFFGPRHVPPMLVSLIPDIIIHIVNRHDTAACAVKVE
jgi:hypothetical protein